MINLDQPRTAGEIGHWVGPERSIAYDGAGVRERLVQLDRPCYLVQNGRGVGITNEGGLSPTATDGPAALLVAPAISRRSLGDHAFRETHGLDCAYMGGSMANGIASVDMVIALGRAGMLGAFGAGGMPPHTIRSAIAEIKRALPSGPYAFNLIHSPSEPALEQRAVDLYLDHEIRTVEASAYLTLTPHVVRYRVAGLETDPHGRIRIRNRVIAKLSRREVAAKFMAPAPPRMLAALVDQGLVTHEQAALAEHVPMADDITVEADSGGHTDNRPLVCLLPSVIAQRDALQAEHDYAQPVRVGAAGGISTPISAFGAFMMGAAYVVTGSVNHSCVEAGTSAYVKRILSEAGMADVMMAPAADMFEMGVNVQVLKRGTMFGLRARKLYELYRTYDSLEAMPPDELSKLERQILRRRVDEVWQSCEAFFSERDPAQLVRARESAKRRMALVFRWYLGLATRWAVAGEEGRELDYQVWCGPSMGAFNDWARGSYLEYPENRYVADVARQIMDGAAYLYRLQTVRAAGFRLPISIGSWIPTQAAVPT
jgi:PfaD family protein